MTANPRPATTWGERFETFVLVLILLTVGGFAGAASFRHVHDWTMTNSPHGTGSWFGWANAVVSELVPIAALLVMRRRRRSGQPVAYPVMLLVGALILSVTAQLAVARPGLSGGVVSVVPALAFAALAKLVLGKAPKLPTAPAVPIVPAAPERVEPVAEAVPVVPQSVPGPRYTNVDDVVLVPEQRNASDVVTPELVHAARRVAVAFLKETGQSITRDELRERLRVRTETASEILRVIRDNGSDDASVARPVRALIGPATR